MFSKSLSAIVLCLCVLLAPPAFATQGSSAPAPGVPPASSTPTPEQIQKAKEKLKQVGGEEKTQESPGKQQTKSVEVQTGEAAPSGQPMSAFEAYVRGKTPVEVSTDLNQFGYDLFAGPPTTFAPGEAVPVGPDYLLGPGDELKISVWGKVDAEYAATIDRDGKISIPQLGVLYLSGLTFFEAKKFLENEFARYFKASEVKTNIAMGNLRTITVYVVGNALRPGSYTLSSLSTLINALFASGGPSKIGSMRDIQVKRSGGTVAHFDLYDFLMKGDKSNDVRLMPEDVIFISPAGPLAGIAGNVKAPAIYELKGETRLKTLIDMAGGLSATGYMQRVQVERVFENRAKVILDFNLEELSENDNIPIADGDLVRVFPIIQAVTNPVELKGNVLRPGTYQWKDGIRIKDLIKSQDDLRPETFMNFALVERLVPPDYHMERFWVNLGMLLAGSGDNENILLRPYDTIVVFSTWDLVDSMTVRVVGAVNRPGEYSFSPNMKLSDLLRLAGGVKDFAYGGKAELTRLVIDKDGPRTERILVDLTGEETGNPDYNLPLRKDDYLFVRAVPEWQKYRIVKVEGEFRFPGEYAIKKGETLSSLIERAGGFTDRAYLRGAVFTRVSVRERQQIQLDESIDRLERQMLAQSSATLETSLSPDVSAEQKIIIEEKRAFLAKLRSIKATGRISIKLDTVKKFKGSTSDITMETGDVLTVMETPNEIQVVGAVYNPTAFIYDAHASISSYIDKAGGATDGANKKDIYVLRSDGTVTSRKASGGFLGLGGFMSSSLYPGDAIVVPERLQRTPWMREVRDITQILYQIAVTAGVLIVTF